MQGLYPIIRRKRRPLVGPEVAVGSPAGPVSVQPGNAAPKEAAPPNAVKPTAPKSKS